MIMRRCFSEARNFPQDPLAPRFILTHLGLQGITASQAIFAFLTKPLKTLDADYIDAKTCPRWMQKKKGKEYEKILLLIEVGWHEKCFLLPSVKIGPGRYTIGSFGGIEAAGAASQSVAAILSLVVCRRRSRRMSTQLHSSDRLDGSSPCKRFCVDNESFLCRDVTLVESLLSSPKVCVTITSDRVVTRKWQINVCDSLPRFEFATKARMTTVDHAPTQHHSRCASIACMFLCETLLGVSKQFWNLKLRMRPVGTSDLIWCPCERLGLAHLQQPLACIRGFAQLLQSLYIRFSAQCQYTKDSLHERFVFGFDKKHEHVAIGHRKCLGAVAKCGLQNMCGARVWIILLSVKFSCRLMSGPRGGRTQDEKKADRPCEP